MIDSMTPKVTESFRPIFLYALNTTILLCTYIYFSFMAIQSSYVTFTLWAIIKANSANFFSIADYFSTDKEENNWSRQVRVKLKLSMIPYFDVDLEI